jgi:hypothetical protein
MYGRVGMTAATLSDFGSSGGDKRPRSVTGKAFRVIDPSQKILLVEKIIFRGKRRPSCDKKEGSC